MQVHGASGVFSMMGQAAAASQASGSFGLSSAISANSASSSAGKTAKSSGSANANPGAAQFGSQTFDALLGAQAGQFSLTKR